MHGHCTMMWAIYYLLISWKPSAAMWSKPSVQFHWMDEGVYFIGLMACNFIGWQHAISLANCFAVCVLFCPWQAQLFYTDIGHRQCLCLISPQGWLHPQQVTWLISQDPRPPSPARRIWVLTRHVMRQTQSKVSKPRLLAPDNHQPFYMYTPHLFIFILYTLVWKLEPDPMAWSQAYIAFCTCCRNFAVQSGCRTRNYNSRLDYLQEFVKHCNRDSERVWEAVRTWQT